MDRTDRGTRRSRALAAIFAAAAISGGAWISSQAVIQNAQRRAFLSSPVPLDPFFGVRWVIVLNFVAIPVFVVCLGAFSAVWIVRREP